MTPCLQCVSVLPGLLSALVIELPEPRQPIWKEHDALVSRPCTSPAGTVVPLPDALPKETTLAPISRTCRTPADTVVSRAGALPKETFLALAWLTLPVVACGSVVVSWCSDAVVACGAVVLWC